MKKVLVLAFAFASVVLMSCSKSNDLTKYEDWKYEKEYRVIEIGFQGEEAFFKDELKSIIFGLKATKNDMDKIIQLCQENSFSHVKFKKAEAVHGKFQLAIKDL